MHWWLKYKQTRIVGALFVTLGFLCLPVFALVDGETKLEAGQGPIVSVWVWSQVKDQMIENQWTGTKVCPNLLLSTGHWSESGDLKAVTDKLKLKVQEIFEVSKEARDHFIVTECEENFICFFKHIRNVYAKEKHGFRMARIKRIETHPLHGMRATSLQTIPYDLSAIYLENPIQEINAKEPKPWKPEYSFQLAKKEINTTSLLVAGAGRTGSHYKPKSDKSEWITFNDKKYGKRDIRKYFKETFKLGEENIGSIHRIIGTLRFGFSPSTYETMGKGKIPLVFGVLLPVSVGKKKVNIPMSIAYLDQKKLGPFASLDHGDSGGPLYRMEKQEDSTLFKLYGIAAASAGPKVIHMNAGKGAETYGVGRQSYFTPVYTEENRAQIIKWMEREDSGCTKAQIKSLRAALEDSEPSTQVASENELLETEIVAAAYQEAHLESGFGLNNGILSGSYSVCTSDPMENLAPGSQMAARLVNLMVEEKILQPAEFCSADSPTFETLSADPNYPTPDYYSPPIGPEY